MKLVCSLALAIFAILSFSTRSFAFSKRRAKPEFLYEVPLYSGGSGFAYDAVTQGMVWPPAVLPTPQPPPINIKTGDNVRPSFSNSGISFNVAEAFMVVILEIPGTLNIRLQFDGDDSAQFSCGVGGDTKTYYSGDYTEVQTSLSAVHAMGDPPATGFSCIGSTDADPGPGIATVTVIGLELSTSSPILALNPVNSLNSPNLCANSSVNLDSASLTENVPLVGAPFYLSYSTQRLLGTGSGWSASNVHLIDTSNGILYLGDGTVLNLPQNVFPAGNGNFYVVNSAGTELYYFTEAGLHFQTRDAVTGVVKMIATYNSESNLISEFDQFGNQTTIDYNSNGWLLTSPYGQQTKGMLDSNGNLASVTNPNGEVYNFTNSPIGLMTSFELPAGQVSYDSYDSTGRLIFDQGFGGDSLSILRTFDLASNSQTVVATTALGRKTTNFSSAPHQSGSTHTIVGPDGGQTISSNTYNGLNVSTDEYGQTTQSNNAQDPRFGWYAAYSSSTSFSVTNSQTVKAITSIQKFATLLNPADPFSFNSLVTSTTIQDPTAERIFTSTYTPGPNQTPGSWVFTSPLGNVVNEVLNQNGLPAQIQVGNLNPLVLAYDTHGRLLTTTQGPRVSSIAYDQFSNIQSTTNALGQKTSYEYDKANRVVSEIGPDGLAVFFGYDPNGNLTKVVTPGQNSHAFTFDLFNLVGSYLPPALGGSQVQEAYSYNLDKQISSVTRASGDVINYNYGTNTGLLNSINSTAVAPNVSVNYVYAYLQNSNLPLSLKDSDGITTQWSYLGSKIQTEFNSGLLNSLNFNTGLQLSFDSEFRLSAYTPSAGSVTGALIGIGYNLDGQVNRSGDLSMSFDQNQQLAADILGSIQETLSRNSFGEVVKDFVGYNGNAIYQEIDTRDSVGRIVSKDEFAGKENGQQDFEYDLQGRLTTVSVNGQVLRSYFYDSDGNRIQFIGPTTIKAKYNAQDQLIQYGETKYTYTPNGDLQTKTEPGANGPLVTSYVFDSLGHLKSVTLPSGKVISYVLDGQGRRIAKLINGNFAKGWIYQGQTQIIGELDSSGNLVKQFVYGARPNVPDYMIFQGKEYRIVSDQVGTPKLIVDPNGIIVEKLVMDEFGNGNHSNLIPFGFAGGLFDSDVQLTHFGARDFDGITGRWISLDPLLFYGGQANLYSYSFNDPMNFVDSDGSFPKSYNDAAFCASNSRAIQQSALNFNNQTIQNLEAQQNALLASNANSCSSDNGAAISRLQTQIQYYQNLNAVLQAQLDSFNQMCGSFPQFPTWLLGR